jgi:O-acetyl-ADP-ribose deacetylase (regulator of RNase III)
MTTNLMYRRQPDGIIERSVSWGALVIMIHSASGDILKQEADARVNTVNCAGVMGRGIAIQFRRAFEDNYKAYRTAAKHGEIRPGQMFVF